jgi:uncharacterized protein YacL
LLTAGGTIDPIIGSLILFKGGTLPAINPVLIAVAVVIAAFFVFVIAKVVGAHRRQASDWREMHISVLPRTTLGKWSVGLAIAFILSFLLAEVLYGHNPDSNQVPDVVLAIIFVGIGGAAFITGLISVIKHKERSILVYIGMAITFWWGLIGAVGYWII